MAVIVPQTTAIPLSERFKIIESKPAPETMLAGPGRSLKLALDMATQSTRISAKQRLGPKVSPFAARQFGKIPVTTLPKRLWRGSRFPTAPRPQFVQKLRRPALQMQSRPFPPHRPFGQKFRTPGAKPNFTPNYAKVFKNKKYTWRNPAFRKPSKATREQLDTDLDAYMAQSRGYLTELEGLMNI